MIGIEEWRVEIGVDVELHGDVVAPAYFEFEKMLFVELEAFAFRPDMERKPVVEICVRVVLDEQVVVLFSQRALPPVKLDVVFVDFHPRGPYLLMFMRKDFAVFGKLESRLCS